MKLMRFAFFANYSRIIFCVFFIFLGSFKLNAQFKYEKECRVNNKEVPPLALEFVKNLPLKTKVKWYREEGLSGITYEAKFRLKQRKYSVEFDSTGLLEDVEMEIKADAIDTIIIQRISQQLHADCVHFQWHKVQLQWKGTAHALRNVITHSKTTTMAPSFEMVVICERISSDDVFVEYLFDPTGRIVSKSEIVLRNSTHLEY